MKNKNNQIKRFISIVFWVIVTLSVNTQLTKAATTSQENFKENFTQNGKACLRTYEGKWEEGTPISCEKAVSAVCERNVTASCVQETKQAVYKTIQATCYRTEPKYRTINENYNSTCYRTQTKYKTVTQRYSSTCYRYIPSIRRSVPYSCTKTRTKSVANGTQRVSYSCSKTRTKRVVSGTQRVPYTCSKRVFDREKIIKAIYTCTKKESYACTKLVNGICTGEKTWNPKKKLASTKCKPNDPNISLIVEGTKKNLAKKGEEATLSFYADEENVDYYEIDINGTKRRVTSNNYRINTNTLGKGIHTIKVKSCNNELGCSSEKTENLKIKKYALPFLE